MILKLHQSSRLKKRMGLIAVDIVLLILALWLAVSIRVGSWYVPSADKLIWFFLAVAFAIPVFIRMGMYRAVIQYMGMQAIWTIFASVSLVSLLFGVALLLGDPYGIPRSSLIIFWLLSLLLVGGCRLVLRWGLGISMKSKVVVAVYGAGDAGVQLTTALKYAADTRVIAFLDDNKALEKYEIAGIKVYACDDVARLIERYGLQQVFIAMPSATRGQRRKVLEKLAPYPVEVRILPGFSELTKKGVQLDAVRDVSIEDLLGRDAVAPNDDLLQQNIVGKVVMVTGAGGSIGSELCRQILRQKPTMLLLFEQSEFALYSIKEELKGIAESDVEIIPLLGSVTHQRRVEHVCQTFAVQTLYHAAAYKHVPLVEYNPIEGVINNVLGTWRTAKAAIAAGVETFVLISTDKAVRPTNVMGASKRLAELGLQALASSQSSTRICMVRFGNVLGSSGSVVPLFSKQIKEGGPVTVTHAEITRYFMTIPEASQLVIQAGAMGKGGDVFVLDMGEPIKIIDLAHKMILLSGLTVKNAEHPEGDISIECTGLRPGEKLYEELLIGDNVFGTQHPLIMRAEEDMLSLARIEALEQHFMEAARDFDVERIRALLLESVVEYQPQCGIQDLTHLRAQRVLP